MTKLKQGYWMTKDGTSQWGIGCPNSIEITKQIHEMEKKFKKCFFFATDYKISK